MARQVAVALLCLSASALVTAPLGAGALDPRPLGVEFCLQADGSHPPPNTHFVVELDDGAQGFVLAYNRAGTEQLLARIFDREGLSVGPEIVLDEPFVGSQEWTGDIVSDRPSGHWLAVWHGDGSPGGDTNLTSVKGRLFDAGGTALGPSFQVNTTEFGVQAEPKATFLADGSFVVVFEDHPTGFPSFFEIRARVFDGSGVALGDDFLVTQGALQGVVPEVVPSPSGGFFVVYRVLDANIVELGLGIREYLGDGTLLTSSVLAIEEWTGALELTGELGASGSLWVAAHADVGVDRIIRLFELEGRGGSWRWTENQIGPGGGHHGSPDLLPTPDGDVSLVWLNNPMNIVGEGTNSVLRFSPGNEAVSAIVDLNVEDPTQAAGKSDAALLGGGRAIAVWESPGLSATCDMLARFFELPELVFEDGFESGDTSAWSGTVP